METLYLCLCHSTAWRHQRSYLSFDFLHIINFLTVSKLFVFCWPVATDTCPHSIYIVAIRSWISYIYNVMTSHQSCSFIRIPTTCLLLRALNMFRVWTSFNGNPAAPAVRRAVTWQRAWQMQIMRMSSPISKWQPYKWTNHRAALLFLTWRCSNMLNKDTI